jgi:hypothetical protein
MARLVLVDIIGASVLPVTFINERYLLLIQLIEKGIFPILGIKLPVFLA